MTIYKQKGYGDYYDCNNRYFYSIGSSRTADYSKQHPQA